MPNTTHINDEVILKDAISKLLRLMEEDREAASLKEKRDKSIQKARLVIELYSNGKSVEELIRNSNGSNLLFNGLLTMPPSVTKEVKESNFEYPADKTWKHKIIAVVKHLNRAVSVQQIVDVVIKHESDYDEKQLTGLISNTIVMNLVKNDILKIYKDGGRAYYYGSPLWWDSTGELKKEYYPIKKQEKIWE